MSIITRACRFLNHPFTINHDCVKRAVILLPVVNHNQVIERGAKAKAGAGAAKGKAGKGAAMKKAILEVEEDAHKLVTQVCGLNYQIDSEPVLIKPDSEYPEWLWTLNVQRPLPPLSEQVCIMRSSLNSTFIL